MKVMIRLNKTATLLFNVVLWITPVAYAQYDKCYICGSNDSYPADETRLGTFTFSLDNPAGTYNCLELDDLGREGKINSVYCDIIRRSLSNSDDPCKCTDDSSAPTAAPSTPDPTAAPVTSSPTLSPVTPEPTAAPVTPAPTSSPVTPSPTISPVTADPTVAPVAPVTTTVPISPPTIAPITPSPSMSPVTPAPTVAPVPTPTASPFPPPTVAPVTPSPTSIPTKSPTPSPIPLTNPPVQELVYPICYICDSAEMKPADLPNQEQNTILIQDPKGIYTCNQLHEAGISGSLPPLTCAQLKPLTGYQSAYDMCSCVSIEGTPSPSPGAGGQVTAPPTPAVSAEPSALPSLMTSEEPSSMPSLMPSLSSVPSNAPKKKEILSTKAPFVTCSVECETDADCTCSDYTCDWRVTNGTKTCSQYISTGLEARSKVRCRDDMGGIRRCGDDSQRYLRSDNKAEE